MNLRFFPIGGSSLYHLLKLLLMGDERWRVFIWLILLARLHKHIKDGSTLFVLCPSYLKAQMDPARAVCTRRRQAGETAAVGCDVQVMVFCNLCVASVCVFL
jgi:hypothetical protein